MTRSFEQISRFNNGWTPHERLAGVPSHRRKPTWVASESPLRQWVSSRYAQRSASW